MLTVGFDKNNDSKDATIEQAGKPHENSKPYLSEKAQVKGTRKSTGLIVVSILLIVLGVLGLFMASMMFGDIGFAAMIGAISAILSGIGFLFVNKK